MSRKRSNPRGSVQVYTGVGVQGPGNNVCQVANGVNAAEIRMIGDVGPRVNRAWAARLQQRRERNLARKLQGR